MGRLSSSRRLAGLAFVSVCVASCGETSVGTPDSGGTSDGGGAFSDGGSRDGGSGDAAPVEAGTVDAAVAVDAGAIDAGNDAAALTCHPSGPLDCSASQVGSNYQCVGLPSNFAKAVTTAIQSVMQKNPSWFDTTQGFPCCPLCIQPASFMAAVIAAIQAGGLCAEPDPNNASIQIVVKHDAACSEGFLVLTSGNFVRNPAKYSETCVPAWL